MNFPSADQRRKRSLEVTSDSSDSSDSDIVRRVKKNARLKSDSGNGGRLETKDVPVQEPQPSSSTVVNLNEENRSSPDSSEVISDLSDSSDSDIAGRVQKNARLKSDSGNGGRLETKVKEPQPSSSKVTNLNEDNRSSPDSSDEQAEKCPICLTTLKNQEVGSPDACNHSFCAECIQKWAKSDNTCPLDRRKFNLILVRSNYNGQCVRSIPVEEPKNNALEDHSVLEMTCRVCGLSLNQEHIFVCNICNRSYHLDCLESVCPQAEIGVWHCPECGFDHDTGTFCIYTRHMHFRLNPIP